jgi:hypothetical protein
VRSAVAFHPLSPTPRSSRYQSTSFGRSGQGLHNTNIILGVNRDSTCVKHFGSEWPSMQCNSAGSSQSAASSVQLHRVPPFMRGESLCHWRRCDAKRIRAVLYRHLISGPAMSRAPHEDEPVDRAQAYRYESALCTSTQWRNLSPMIAGPQNSANGGRGAWLDHRLPYDSLNRCPPLPSTLHLLTPHSFPLPNS